MGEKVEMVETDRWREAESLGPESWLLSLRTWNLVAIIVGFFL